MKTTALPPDLINAALLAYQEGRASSRKVAHLLGVSKPTALKILRDRGVQVQATGRTGDYVQYSAELRDSIISQYTSGMTLDELHLATGVTVDKLKRALLAWGCELRRRGPRRSQRLNEEYFDRIDTENKAYWLGFIWADGCLTGTGAQAPSLEFGLHKDDADAVRQLAAELGMDEDSSVKPTGPASVRIRACSAKLGRSLSRLGLIRRKSYNDSKPAEGALPAELEHHFIRGYFDGNGSINLNPSWASGGASFCGRESVLEWISERLISASITHRILPCHNTVEAGKLLIGRADDLLRFGRLMYLGATVKLARKYQTFARLAQANNAPMP